MCYLTVLSFQSLTQASGGWSQGVSEAAFLLQAVSSHLFPCLFQVLDAAYFPWLVAPSSIFKTILHLWPFSCSHISPSNSLSLYASLTFKHLYGYIGPIPENPDRIISLFEDQLLNKSNSTYKLNSSLPWTLTYSQMLRARMCMSLGAVPWLTRAFPNGSMGKEPTCSAKDMGDLGLIPGSGRSPGGGNGNPLQFSCPPGGGNGNPLQFSCLGNPMDVVARVGHD